ncbi:MAG: peptide chain release factor N(5)-glutamine methyltransferase [Clostridia bacterium]|nr:peptide chain release factor N(5)-glutamine methyltransferase [Clostridia bacterium]
MTLSDIVKILSDGSVENARLEARALFSHFAKIPVERLIAENPVATEEIIAAAKKRAGGYPLQYILGEVEFFREAYKVSEDCLIPRSDTEILVEYAVNNLPKGTVFADLCTGSGCIAISVLANRPDLSAVAVDISEKALALARENAEKNGVSDRITFICADLLGERLELSGITHILSNPPYITDKAMQSLPRELAYEPRLALSGGADGDVFYKKLVSDYGGDADMIFEIGYDQKEMITDIARSHGLSVKIIKDLSKNDRVAVLTR